MFNFSIVKVLAGPGRPYQITVTVRLQGVTRGLTMRSGGCFTSTPAKCPWEFVV
jgi:hypothetical protein